MKSRLRTHLQALGAAPLPVQIEAGGGPYSLGRIFKHDFFAVTAMYEGVGGRVILKIERLAPFFGIPMSWLGRRLADREVTALNLLSGVEGVPQVLQRWGRTGLVRRYIDGHPMRRNERVNDDFHPRLRALVEALHFRGLAYVDLNKSENVLVGDDGRPYLIDFQIAWFPSPRRGGELWSMRKIRQWFQQGDLYHLVKLQRRSRPDQLTPEAIAASYRKPWHVRLYRRLMYPWLWTRRRLLDRLDVRHGSEERGRVVSTGD